MPQFLFLSLFNECYLIFLVMVGVDVWGYGELVGLVVQLL